MNASNGDVTKEQAAAFAEENGLRAPTQITKLPKWAQEFIRTLVREREVAIKELNNWTDQQTPSPFFIDEMVCLGEGGRIGGGGPPSQKRRYIEGRRLSVEWQGVLLDIILREDHIDLQYGVPNWSSTEVALIPVSYQKMKLVAQEHMYNPLARSGKEGDK